MHGARVSTEAISANAALLARRPGGLVADVSFDGYGHGAIAAARAAIAGGATSIGVSRDVDADELRAAGISVSIVVGRPQAMLELYGLTDDARFVPAMRVSAEVVGTKTVEPGDGVSYGYTFRATRRGALAMIAIGYADGLDRAASNVGTILLGGGPRRIAGRVAMNVHMLDVGDHPVSAGDEAVVFGPERRASEWAASIGRRADEVAIEFGQKLPRSWS